ncbi:MAG: ABC transporter permease [Acidobacteria bacterium]|nr:ABC transporter permease [Acidobacteriota bacterium]
MTQYIIKRLLAAIPTIFFVTLLVFTLMRLIPGDAALRLSLADGGGVVTEENLERQRQAMGLHRSWPHQYKCWSLGDAFNNISGFGGCEGNGLLRGDLGVSLRTGHSINGLIKDRLPLSLELVVLAVLVAPALAVPLGIISAVNQDRPIDYAARLFTIFGLSVPDFVWGTLVILFLTVYIGDVTFGLLQPWLPPLYEPLLDDPWVNIQALILPAAIVGYRLSAISARMMRSTMLEVLREDYVRTARAKGLAERPIILKHALRNAVIPVLTIMAGQIAFVFGGTVIVEQIFRLAGMGRLTLESVRISDYPIVQATVLVMAIVFVLVNLAVDLAYGLIDPRIRYS